MSVQQQFAAFVEDRVDEDLRSDALAHSSVVCAATPGAPVIFVSDAFEAHTGYSRQEALGRSLSFLQGPNTEKKAVDRFRTLIATEEAGTICITNYRKDGTPFVHACEMRPIHDERGQVTHFIAIQRVMHEVAATTA